MPRPAALSGNNSTFVQDNLDEIRRLCSVHSRKFSQDKSYYFSENNGASTLKGDADNLYIEGVKAVDLYNQFYQNDIKKGDISTAKDAADMIDERFDMMLQLFFSNPLSNDETLISKLKTNYSQNLMGIGSHLNSSEKLFKFKKMINLSRVKENDTAIRCETFVAVDEELTRDEQGDYTAYVPAKEISTFHAVSMSREGAPFRLEAVNVSTGFLNLMGHEVAETFFEWLVTLFHQLMGSTDSLKEAHWEHTDSNSDFVAQPILKFPNEGGGRPAALAGSSQEQPNPEERRDGPSFS